MAVPAGGVHNAESPSQREVVVGNQVEKGKNSLVKLLGKLALGAIPIAFIGGEIFSGGAISAGLLSLLGGISKLDWGGLLNPAEIAGKLGRAPGKLGEIYQTAKMTTEANLNLDPAANINTILSNPQDALKNLVSGQGLTKDGGQDPQGPL